MGREGGGYGGWKRTRNKNKKINKRMEHKFKI